MKSQYSRRSYRGLSSLPAYLLMQDDEIVASVRAHKIEDAATLFKKAKLKGNRVIRSKETRGDI